VSKSINPLVPGPDLDQVLSTERTALVRALVYRVGSHDTAEDLAHEACVRVIQALRQRPIRDLAAFLHQTARNLAIDHLRNRSWRQRHELCGADEQELGQVGAEAARPDEIALQSEALDRLQNVIAGLSDRQQRILGLYRLDGLKQQQIAQCLGVSLSTVEKDLRQAMLVLLRHRNGQV